MKKEYNLLIICLLWAISAVGQSQGPSNKISSDSLNFPAAIGDECTQSPFLCGNYLENYRGVNAGLQSNVLQGVSYDAAGFLRFAPCSNNLALNVSVSNCTPGSTGLLFGLLQGQCGDSLLFPAQTILDGSSAILNFPNVAPDSTYALIISGLNNSVCEFQVQVVDGMGTAEPPTPSCDCADSGVQGPDAICPGIPATFTAAFPNCNITPGAPQGGNGSFCLPPGACPGSGIVDSFRLIWHIPAGTHFVGDSTGTTIVIELDTNYFSLDTMRMDQVWASWELISSDTFPVAVDTLMFCNCTAVGCSGAMGPKNVIIRHDIEHFQCTLTCVNNPCFIDGVPYYSPGLFVVDDIPNCVRKIIEIDSDFNPPPPPFGPPQRICKGETAVLTVLPNQPGVFFQWQTGQTGPSISVSPTTSTNYMVTATNVFNGCTSIGVIQVIVDPVSQTNLPDQPLCPSGVVTVCGQSFTAPGAYTVTCTNVFGCDSIIHFNVIQGPETEENLGVVGFVSCSSPCFEYNGSMFCAPGDYSTTQNCISSHFTIAFKKDTLEDGLAGALTCALPCLNIMGQTFCAPGNYTVEDSCSVHHFTIDQNIGAPVCQGPTHQCLPNNTEYTVSFAISGQPPFKVNGNSIPGSFYLSPPIPNGQQYVFVVKQQSNDCETTVTGNYNCASFCTTSAGVLSGTLLEGCAGQTAIQAQSIADPTLATGDVLEYHLKSPAGSVIARNTTGYFAFEPGVMTEGATYQIQRIAGQPDANGHPDPGSPCTDTSAVQPCVFYPLPAIKAVETTAPPCVGIDNGEILIKEVAAATEPVAYALNSGAFSNNNRFGDLAPGAYTVVAQDAAGCTADSTFVLEAPLPLTLDLGPDQTIFLGESATITTNSSAPPASIVWSAENGTNQIGTASWTIQPESNVLITCTIADANGCLALDQTWVLVNKSQNIFRPNVLSTLGKDTENQHFTLYSTEGWIKKINTLQIFTRWGELVWERQGFAANDPQAGWDGTFKGGQARPGVYVYKAEVALANGETETFTGDVTVVK